MRMPINSKKSMLLAAVVVGIILLTSAFLLFPFYSARTNVGKVVEFDNPLVSSNSSARVVGKLHGSNVPRTVEEQTQMADTVALVTVEKFDQAQWDTPDGNAPPSIQKAIQSGYTPVIFRRVTLRVERFLKNPQPTRTIIVRQIGGEVDGAMFLAEEDMNFEVGTQAIIFLTEQQAPSPEKWGYNSVYVINGTTAFGKWDNAQLSVDDLLSRVAKAAQ